MNHKAIDPNFIAWISTVKISIAFEMPLTNLPTNILFKEMHVEVIHRSHHFISIA